MPPNGPQPFSRRITDKGRVVTKGTEWWYKNTGIDKHSGLYCIHNKSLLEGCNECVDESAGQTENS